MITPVAMVGWSETGRGLSVDFSIPAFISMLSDWVATAFLNAGSFSGYGEVVRTGVVDAPFLP